MEKRDARTLKKEAQKEIRILAIEHWKKNGNMAEAARIFGVSYRAVRKWVSKYSEKGVEHLAEDRRGRPIGKELTRKQEVRIIWKISTKQPEQLRLAFGLWTRENVGELINREYGIKRSARQIGRYLKEWGFTPQKPAYKAYEQSSEEVQNWLDVEYPLIQAQAKKQGSMIFWGDETGIRSHDHRGRSFSLKGATPTILKTGKHFGMNMISAVNNRGKLHFMIYRGAMNGTKFLIYLKRLIRCKIKKIFLIVDNLPAHKTKSVQGWLKDNNQKIKLFYLPKYAPELNPDEYLNQDLKANVVDKIKMNEQADLEKSAENFLNKRRRNPEQVKKYFNHRSVRYAAM